MTHIPIEKISHFYQVKDRGYATECWEWLGTKTDEGYPLVKFNGKLTGAHRAAWIIRFGEIPKGLWLCHKCDNPPCIRLEHLFLGTPWQNFMDAVLKLRIPRIKLNPQRAEEIRSVHQEFGLSLSQLSKRFGVSRSICSRVIRREIWIKY